LPPPSARAASLPSKEHGGAARKGVCADGVLVVGHGVFISFRHFPGSLFMFIVIKPFFARE
jgi:hypothetical protein